jgi:hypothetical protein
MSAPGQWFLHAVSTPPRPWQKVVSVLLALMVPVAIGAKRGWVIGVAAAVVYGAMLLGGSLAWQKRVTSWSARHPVLDSAFIAPLMFFALAYITNLSLALCLAVALATWVVVGGLGAWRRRHRVAVRSAQPS